MQISSESETGASIFLLFSSSRSRGRIRPSPPRHEAAPTVERRIHPAGGRIACGLPDESGVPVTVPQDAPRPRPRPRLGDGSRFDVRRLMLDACSRDSGVQCCFPRNNKSLPGLSVEQGQMGDGSAPSSLSHADIRHAPFGGCQLPDAILHGKRSLRPRGRAVQRLADTGFRVRLFSLLELMVAPPACKPDEDTSVI